MPVLVALHDPEHALPRDHLCSVSARDRLALVRGHLIDFLLLGPASTQRAELVGHLPDAVLIGDQYIAVPPCQAMRPIEILHMPFDEIGTAAAACFAQQRQ